MIHNYLSQALFDEFLKAIKSTYHSFQNDMDASFCKSHYPSLIELFMYADAIDKGANIAIPTKIVDNACEFVKTFYIACVNSDSSLQDGSKEQLVQRIKDYYDRIKVTIKTALRENGKLSE